MRLANKSPKKSSKSDLPKHVAIIMDGNGRWARSRTFTRVLGHQRGVDVVRDVVTYCKNRGVKYLTLYAFSEENWDRPKLEVVALMAMLKKFLVVDRPLLKANDVRLSAIGNLSKLPADVLSTLRETEKLTQSHKSMLLTLALSYGGRSELIQAVQAIAQKVAKGVLDPKAIDENLIQNHLFTSGMPDPDLMIRTSGEHRVSNFLTWQSVYTELYFTPTLWPDFTTEELEQAFQNYMSRERRFGKTSEQLAKVVS